MKELTTFLKYHVEDQERAITALFISLGYHMSKHKGQIKEILKYANQEYEEK